ncbi:MAG: MFS transporter [Roseburia sp.]|nr:MFS transporter [Roseburia sp.]MCM1098177.1 MFS transporter [Ruminococcus flavefaciens]
MQKKITDKRISFLLFMLCWGAYFTSYIGRLNYSSAISSMNAEGIVSRSQAGAVSMIYFFAYAAGQLINGMLADRINPKWMLFAGLSLSGIANGLMGTVPVYPWVLLFWGMNGYTQAMIWPPVIRIIAERFTEEKRKKYIFDFASSMTMGTFASYLLSAGALRFLGWRFVFRLPALLLFAAAVSWILGYGYIERFVRKTDDTGNSDDRGSADEIADMRTEEGRAAGKQPSFGEILLGSGILAALLPVIIHGMIKDGVVQWVPTYLHEQFGVTAAFSAVLTMALPLLNLSGAYLAKWADRKNPGRELRSASIFFMLATAALALLATVGKFGALLTALLFAVVTALIMAANVLFVNVIPVHFEKQGKVATVSGFLNASAYVGSAISTYVISLLAERFGWGVTVGTWIGVMTLGVVCLLIYRDRYIAMPEGQQETERPQKGTGKKH